MKYLASLAFVLSTGCALSGAEDGDEVEQAVSTRYVSILDFAKTDQSQWYDAIHSLDRQFDEICGDTFCEGEYGNLTPLTFGCSVTSKLGNVKDCAWTFAAAAVGVDPRNAAILVDAPTFECHVKMKTTAVKLANLLTASDASLHAPLPGAPAATPSIYDQLGECFEHPIGATPMQFSTTGTASYTSAGDYYATSTGYQRWRAARAALIAGFDNVCGDTFCSSDFGDLQSLDFQCSITKSTGNVKACAWVFGGSYYTVAELGGAIQETAHTRRCTVAVKGSISQLIDTLTAPGTTDAIRRPLPGVTTTAYDGLLGCLP